MIASRIAIGDSLTPHSASTALRNSSKVIVYNRVHGNDVETIKYYDSVSAGATGIVASGEHSAMFSYGSDFSAIKGKYILRNGKYYKISSTSAVNKKSLSTEIRELDSAFPVRPATYDSTHNLALLAGIEISNGNIVTGNVIGENYDSSTNFEKFSGLFLKATAKYGSETFYFKIGKDAQYFSRSIYTSPPQARVVINFGSSWNEYLCGDVIELYAVQGSRPVPYVITEDTDPAYLIGKYTKYSSSSLRQITNVTVGTAYSSSQASSGITNCIGYYVSDENCSVTMEGQQVVYVPASTGIQYEYEDEDLIDLQATNGVGIIGEELTIDTLTATVRTESDDPRTIKYGTPVMWYNNNSLYGKYYFRGASRGGKYNYSLDCMSIIGLSETAKNYGGIFTGEPFSAVLDSIIGDSTQDYTVDSDVQNIKVFGWLPYDTVRNNLHRLLFAFNVSILRVESAPDRLRFAYLGADAITNIADDNIYMQGMSDYNKRPTYIEVTEHTFIIPYDRSNPVDLFDNTDNGVPADNQLVIFNSAPIYQVELSGDLSIVESGVNYAIVNGVGILRGVPYIHQTKIYGQSTGVPGAESIDSITDDGLITLYNSHNVMNRLLAYYDHSNIVKMDIRLNGEHCGNRYAFENTFDEQVESAVLAKMDINVTSFIKGSCEFIDGAGFTGAGDRISAVNTYTGTGSIEVNQAKKAHVVLIGGGEGGESGYAGADGEINSTSSGGSGGEGGDGGNPGKGGKIFAFDIELQPGTIYSYSAGSAGVGASGANSTHEKNNSAGTKGGDTTFSFGSTVYSSANGFPSETGFLEIVSNVRYAYPGQNHGVRGGAGGKGGDAFGGDTSVSFIPGDCSGENGESAGIYFGGRGGTGANFTGGQDSQHRYMDVPHERTSGSTSYLDTYHRFFGCGGGGGGAYGNQNPANGTIPSGVKTTTSWSGGGITNYVWAQTLLQGAGGNGATPAKPSAPAASMYGCGGDGGHGGGGGGGSGGVILENDKASTISFTYNLQLTPTLAARATGAKGGDGADGRGGCVIVYYFN